MINPAAQPAKTTTIRPRRALRGYLWGEGIEIGALHIPMDVAGLNITSLKYVDRMSAEDLKTHYKELAGLPLTRVDIVDDGEKLHKIPEDSLDFIIGNHFIEHTRNPAGTIKTWLGKLRKGGVIFMAVPDKRVTFDMRRPVTPVDHLLDDFRRTDEDRVAFDREHVVEWATYIPEVRPTPDKIEEKVKKIIDSDRSIHFHTFTLQTFLEFLRRLQWDFKFPFKLRACADIVAGTNEFVVVLGRV